MTGCVARGGELALDAEDGRTLVRRIADRIAASPGGVIRSYRDGGLHQARSHGALWRQAGDVAAALSATGVSASSFVVILADDILDFLPSVWGCLRGGFVPVALMGAAREAAFRGDPSFAEVMSLLGQPAVIVDEPFAALTRRLAGGTIVPLASVTPAVWNDCTTTQDPAWLVATSGSTGRLKLAALSNSAVVFRNFAKGAVVDVPLPHALGTFPLDGVTGQHVAFQHHESWTQIAPQVLARQPGAVLDAIEAFEISVLTLTTSMIRGILAAEAGRVGTRRLGSLRLAGLGAEPVAAGLVQDFAALLARHGADPGVLIAGYGTTETGSLTAGSRTLLRRGRMEPASLGEPWHGVAMRIVDTAGAMVARGVVGELEVSCPAKMFSGYWGEPEASAAAFTADGWWRTGDRGELVDGALTLHGRSRDVLIQNGRKFALADVDAEVQQALGVVGVGYAYRFADVDGEALGIAFDGGGAVDDAVAAEAIRAAVVRRFGLTPGRVAAVEAHAIPRTASGKVRREALAALAATAAQAHHRWAVPDADSGGQTLERLASIWCDVLALDRAATSEDDFFALGGDSLRAVTLDLQVAQAFGVRVPGEAFFAAPVFGNLVRLVRQRLAAPSAMHEAAVPEPDVPWTLPAALGQGLALAIRHWPGERAHGDSAVLGFNLDGDGAPIVWVFNTPDEASRLSAALGPAQPLYAFRSGHQLTDYREDDIQALALRYVTEIEHLRPAGPLFVAGNCQGGIIALAMAQHLLRRKRHLPLLVLVDWMFDLQPYAGRVLMIASADNMQQNFRRHFARPELAFARAFAAFDVEEIPGGYGEVFQPGPVDALIGLLHSYMARAKPMPTTLLPADAYRATVTVAGMPAALRPGERRTIRVGVRNDSAIGWAATKASGLSVACRWLDPGHDGPVSLQRRASLPGLGPGEVATVALRIVAPGRVGLFRVVVDVVEDGNRWFTRRPEGGALVAVRVPPAASLPWWPIR